MKKLLFFVLLLGTSITHLYSMEEGGAIENSAAREHIPQLVLFPHPSSDGTTVEVEQGIAEVIFTHLATLDSENLGELYRACNEDGYAVPEENREALDGYVSPENGIINDVGTQAMLLIAIYRGEHEYRVTRLRELLDSGFLDTRDAPPASNSEVEVEVPGS